MVREVKKQMDREMLFFIFVVLRDEELAFVK